MGSAEKTHVNLRMEDEYRRLRLKCYRGNRVEKPFY